MRLGLSFLAAMASIGHAMAYVPSPDAGQIQAAAEQGKTLAAPHEGYSLKDYVLYEAKNVLTLDPANGDVDAVVVATPVERTRHASFLHAYSGEKAEPATDRRDANLPDGWIEIIVFGHSNSRKDEEFLKQFTPAVLQLSDRRIMPSATEDSDSDLDVYPRAQKEGMRYIGTVTYRYNLTQLPDIDKQRMSVVFDDASGKHFDLPLDLARYN